MELKEKAERWGELCEGLEYGVNTPVSDILQEITLINRDNNTRKDKLEAIKTYLDDNYLSTHIPVIDIRKILEAKD